MRTTASFYAPDPVDYAAPKKYVLVVSCVDARLLAELVRFLEHDNLTNRYYHITFAGTAMGLTDRVLADLPDPENPPAAFGHWRQMFIDHLRATVLLTEGKINDIYIVQHADCGAFRAYLGKSSDDMTDREEVQLHRQYAKALLNDIAANFCTTYNPTAGKSSKPIQRKVPSIHTFYMDLRGFVKHLDSFVPNKDNGGVCIDLDCSCDEPAEAEAKSDRTKKRGK